MTPRRNGAYAPLGANYLDDDAIAQLDHDERDRAELLFLRSLVYCARNPQTDGFISDVALRTGKVLRRRRGIDKEKAWLLELGLYAPADGGVTVNAWLKWNQSYDEITRKRAKDAARHRPGDDGDSTGTPNGIPPEPDGSPPTLQADSTDHMHVISDARHVTADPASARKPRTPTNNGADVVAAFAEARGAAGMSISPAERGRVSRDAKRLLDGNVASLPELEAAGRELGAGPYDDLERQVNIRRARANGRGPATPAADTRWMARNA